MFSNISLKSINHIKRGNYIYDIMKTSYNSSIKHIEYIDFTLNQKNNYKKQLIRSSQKVPYNEQYESRDFYNINYDNVIKNYKHTNKYFNSL